jgi:hypothetical protein
VTIELLGMLEGTCNEIPNYFQENYTKLTVSDVP